MGRRPPECIPLFAERPTADAAILNQLTANLVNNKKAERKRLEDEEAARENAKHSNKPQLIQKLQLDKLMKRY